MHISVGSKIRKTAGDQEQNGSLRLPAGFVYVVINKSADRIFSDSAVDLSSPL
ncbi:hypothetical protein BH18THE2_BH18THE2_41860 [soil metagenome]